MFETSDFSKLGQFGPNIMYSLRTELGHIKNQRGSCVTFEFDMAVLHSQVWALVSISVSSKRVYIMKWCWISYLNQKINRILYSFISLWTEELILEEHFMKKENKRVNFLHSWNSEIVSLLIMFSWRPHTPAIWIRHQTAE